MMKVDKDKMEVKLDKKDIDKAFSSQRNLYNLFRTIMIETYGQGMADYCFPPLDKKGEQR